MLYQKYLTYKQLTLRLVRAGLKTAWQDSSDVIYSAVVQQAGNEFISNNSNEGRLHLLAAVHMARAAGGLAMLTRQQLESTLIVDTELATLSGLKPIFRDLGCSRAAQRWLPDVPHAIQMSGVSFQETLKFDGQLSATDELLPAMRSLFETSKMINSFSLEDADDATLVMRAHLAGFELCECMLNRHTLSESGKTAHINLRESIRLAGLLVVMTTHLKSAPIRHVHRKLTTDLASTLKGSQLDDITRRAPSLITWILFIGSYGSMGTDQFDYFGTLLATALNVIRIVEWIEIKTALQNYPYIRKEFDRPFKEIWDIAGRRSPSHQR